MLTKRILPVLLALLLLSAAARALSPTEQTFVDEHLSDVLTTTTTRLTAPGLGKVFSGMIFKINVTPVGGGSEVEILAAKIDNKLVPVSRPSSDADCPEILKILNPKFKLTDDDSAQLMQNALDVLYPILMDDDKKAASFDHTDNTWTFYRGKFFDKKLGFIFTTDKSGKITAAKFALKID